MTTSPPWNDVSTIIEALAGVEDLARSRGWREPRRPVWAGSDVKRAESRLGIGLSENLRRFALWYDPGCWGWMQVPLDPDGRPEQDPTDQTEQLLRVHDLSEWRVDAADPPTIADGIVDEFLREHCGVGRAFPESWRCCRFLRFGSTIWLDALLVCVEGPTDAIGRVGLTVMDDPQILFLADSLPHWLAKLAITRVNDPTICVPEDGFSESDLGRAVVEEFNRLNPHSDRFR